MSACEQAVTMETIMHLCIYCVAVLSTLGQVNVMARQIINLTNLYGITGLLKIYCVT